MERIWDKNIATSDKSSMEAKFNPRYWIDKKSPDDVTQTNNK